MPLALLRMRYAPGRMRAEGGCSSTGAVGGGWDGMVAREETEGSMRLARVVDFWPIFKLTPVLSWEERRLTCACGKNIVMCLRS